jgi:hypothetical protein
MQLRVGNLSVEPLPYGNGDVLGCRNAGAKLRNFEVQVAVVVDAYDLVFEDVLELFEIDDEARHRIDLASYSDLKRVIVAMAVAIRALAEDLMVLLVGP